MPLDKKRAFPKRTRLRSFSYIGMHRYFLTIVTYGNKPLFESEQTVLSTYSYLQEYAEKARFNILAFCFMPDHFHLLVEGTDEKSNFTSFVSRFKQVSGYYFKQSTGIKLWQDSYHEHVLRSDEYSETIAEYILNNPVRKELAAHYTDYPYSSSLWHKPFSGLKP